MKYPKRVQYRYAKSPYAIRNWPEYEAGIRIYAYNAIEADLTIRMVFHLPLIQTEGFLRSLAATPGIPRRTDTKSFFPYP